MDKEIEFFKKQISDLELHNSRMSDALEWAIEFLDKYADVIDGLDGIPIANEAMQILLMCEKAHDNKSYME